MGFACYYMISETKSFYFYPVVQMMLPFSAIGLANVKELVVDKAKKNKLRYALALLIPLIIVYNCQFQYVTIAENNITVKYDYSYFTNIIELDNDCFMIEVPFFGSLNEDTFYIEMLNSNEEIIDNLNIYVDKNERNIVIIKNDNSVFEKGKYVLNVSKIGNSSGVFGFCLEDDIVKINFYNYQKVLFNYYNSNNFKDSILKHMYYMK